jgi:PTS system nitrogen regulatory IIA component
MDMSLLKYLTLDTVSAELKGTNKREIINSLFDLIVKTGKVKDPKAAFAAVMDRESKMSTGMENGIAIPHGKTDGVDELLAAVGISKTPIDFGSLDGKPSRIFIMTLSPSHKTGPHIQFLSEISKLLRNADQRNKVLAAEDSRAILQILADRQ